MYKFTNRTQNYYVQKSICPIHESNTEIETYAILAIAIWINIIGLLSIFNEHNNFRTVVFEYRLVGAFRKKRMNYVLCTVLVAYIAFLLQYTILAKYGIEKSPVPS